jgi:type II secretory pathway pseudopilin PulG
MLLGLIVAIAIISMMLAVAAPRVAFELRREREMESARRADQYVRAIRKFYLKNKAYPGSVKQLENTNLVRYLRQEYVDPLTGKADYRLIAVGQNKTTATSFFGQPLAGIATTGLGAAAGMQSAGVSGPGGAGAPGVGGPGAAGAGGAFGAGGFGAGGANGSGAAGGTGGTAGANGAAGGGAGPTDNSGTPGGSTAGPGGSSGLGSVAGMQSSGMPGSGGASGPFMGVGSSASGDSIIEPNGQTKYPDWEFLYDPRVELLRAKAGMNAGAGSVGAGALGAGNPMGTPGATSPFGSTTGPANSTNPAGPAGGPGQPGTNPTQP